MAASIALREFRKMTARKTSQSHLSAAAGRAALETNNRLAALLLRLTNAARGDCLLTTAGLLNGRCIGDALATLSLQMCCKRAALIASRCFNAAGRMSRDARGFLGLRKGTLRSLLI